MGESMLPERQEAQRQFMILNNIETFNDADRVYPRKGETKEELVARFVAVGISKENLIRYGYLEAEAGEEIVEEDGGEGSEEEGEEEEQTIRSSNCKHINFYVLINFIN